MSEQSSNNSRTLPKHQLFTSSSTMISSTQIMLPFDIINSAASSPRKRVLKCHVDAIKEGVLSELKLAHGRHVINNTISNSLTIQELFETSSVRDAANEAYLSGIKKPSHVRSKVLLVVKNFVQNKLDSRIEETHETRYRYNPQGKLNVQEIKQGHTLVDIKDNITGKSCVVKGSEVAYSIAHEVVRKKRNGINLPMKKSITSSVHAALRCNSGGNNVAHGMTWTLPESHMNPTIVSLQEAMGIFELGIKHPSLNQQVEEVVVKQDSPTDVSDTEVDPEPEIKAEEVNEESEAIKMEMGDPLPLHQLVDHLDQPSTQSPKHKFQTDEDRTESEDEIRRRRRQKPRLTLSPIKYKDSSSSNESSNEEEEGEGESVVIEGEEPKGKREEVVEEDSTSNTNAINTGDLFRGIWSL